ncbi:MAG: DUF2064 domain-containing protein [Mycobacteriales bacterium]
MSLPGPLTRVAALLLAGPRAGQACSPGVDSAAFAAAMASDVLDVLDGLSGVDAAIAATRERLDDARAASWPSTLVVEVDAADPLGAAMRELAAAGYRLAVLVAPDVPDIPELVLAKPFSALGSASVALAPAHGGGLAALGVALPAPDWLLEAHVDLGTDDAVAVLQAAAPRRRDVRATLPWRRLRAPADIAALDPGLEGWDATRALLGR